MRTIADITVEPGQRRPEVCVDCQMDEPLSGQTICAGCTHDFLIRAERAQVRAEENHVKV